MYVIIFTGYDDVILFYMSVCVCVRVLTYKAWEAAVVEVSC